MSPSSQNQPKLDACTTAVCGLICDLRYLVESEMPRKEAASGTHGWDPGTLETWAVKLEESAVLLREQAALLDA